MFTCDVRTEPKQKSIFIFCLWSQYISTNYNIILIKYIGFIDLVKWFLVTNNLINYNRFTGRSIVVIMVGPLN